MPAPDPDPAPSTVDAFWEVARVRARLNPTGFYAGERPLGILPPPAWSFGATPDQADRLLALVLSGTKTATASALWDYEAEGEVLPAVGDLGIVTDGRGVPRALIATTRVETVPFDDVDAEHAHLEGEGDRTLTSWREVHRRFFSEHAAHERGFSPDMPVVLERFAVLYGAPADPVTG
ncbi:ASCH domain-containing protein [Phycicoccus avicenniae]|uniref:ASCH domain-containing protein n=1 Tax=Phycicoccus avicenniae TaxID=2828860 RepID=UPI003D26549C